MQQAFQVAAMILAVGVHVHAQGTFENLDFQSGSIPPSTGVGGGMAISAALPGWTGYSIFANEGGVAVSEPDVCYDGVEQSSIPFITFADSNAPAAIKPPEGKYSVVLFSESVLFPTGTRISQTGFIPNGTQSLLMNAWESQPSSPVVAINGQTIDMVPIQTFANYTLYAGNISSFAGQVGTLSFTENPIGLGSEFELDDISFSPNAVVPEPSSLALMGFGGLLFALYRRFGSKEVICQTK